MFGKPARCKHSGRHIWKQEVFRKDGKPYYMWVQRCKTCPNTWTMTNEEYKNR